MSEIIIFGGILASIFARRLLFKHLAGLSDYRGNIKVDVSAAITAFVFLNPYLFVRMAEWMNAPIVTASVFLVGILGFGLYVAVGIFNEFKAANAR